MTEKRFYLNEGEVGILKILDLKEDNEAIYHTASKSDMKIVVELLNTLSEENEQLKDALNQRTDQCDKYYKENEQLKKDVEYWKQVASQYSNKLNVLEHCKKYKTECKDIHWSSD